LEFKGKVMERERYELERTVNGLDFVFFSEGPKGRIAKGIRFREVKGIGRNTFNLAFGDLKEDTGRLDDRAITNNDDRLKVLNTVAAAIVDFLSFRPTAIILVKGSSLSRVRLYQMMIASIWSNIHQQFEVYGRMGREWAPFQIGLNYEEFILFKKIQ
jgi:hypothetical protein